MVKSRLQKAWVLGGIVFSFLCQPFCFSAAQDVDTYFDRGSQDLNQGNLEQAVSDFTKVIELDPKTHEAYYNRGAAKASIFAKENPLARTKTFVVGDCPLLSEAIGDFTRAIDIAPDKFQYYLARGSAYIFIRQTKNAVTDLTRAIELNPGQADIYFNRGLAYILSGDIKDGWADIDKSKKMGYAPPKEAMDNLEKMK